MIRIRFGRGRLATALFCAFLAGAGHAEDLAIRSFDGTGRLTFNALNDGTNYSYRVEWAPSPSGPWTNFLGAAACLDCITAAKGSVVTGTVPMCYRVVAYIGDYLVIDVSGGPSAAAYPVSYLSAVPSGGWTDEFKTTKIVLRRVQAGTFNMGSPDGESGRMADETQHGVTLSQPFFVGVFEITQKQWERVLGTWPSGFAATPDMCPVETVSYEAIRGAGGDWPATNTAGSTSFMGKLRAKTGQAFDLPTEAQWEYAARAGATGPYAGTGVLGEMGWSNGNSGGKTHPIGRMAPNAWGLYDMHGNAWEWCLDWYGAYPGTVSDPGGAPSGSARVIRGGSYGDLDFRCRLAFRGSYTPGGSLNIIGFRIVLSADQ